MRFFKKLFGNDPRTPNQPPSEAEKVDLLNQTFRFVIIDVETANSDTASICQIGLALVTFTGVIHTISLLVDPEAQFDSFNTNLHGIDEQAVQGKPVFADAIQFFRSFLQRHPLIQHSNFDKQALTKACDRYGLPKLQANWHDSVVIARRAWPELKGKGGHGLGNLKSFLELEFRHHDAEEDARAAAQVVLQAEAKTGQTFAELSVVGRPTGAKFERSVTIDGNQNGPLFGHVACFSGSLSLTRVEAATLAAGAGIAVKSTVTKKTTLLIVGDQDLSVLNGHSKSSKHRRAEELISVGQNIRVIGESEFVMLIEK